MKKKITALLVVLVLIVSTIPVSAAPVEQASTSIGEISARLIGCPPRIGASAGVVLFEFTGSTGHLFEQPSAFGIGNEGWLYLVPGEGRYENVRTFQADRDYYYRATVQLKQEYVEDFYIVPGGALQLNLKDGNNQTVPLQGKPYVSNWNTPNVELTLGPFRATENAVMPLSQLDLSLEEPLTLTSGGTLPTPALHSSVPEMTTAGITWYRDGGEAPELCYEDHKVVPLCAYFCETVLECSDPAYVAVPKDMMIVKVDGTRWRVTEVNTSGGKIFIHLWSPPIYAADNRIALDTAAMTIPYTLIVGSVPVLPEISVPAGSPYTCTGVQWVDPETREPISMDGPAVRGKDYGFAITLEIRGEAARSYVFDEKCIACYNQSDRMCSAQEVRIDQVDGTSTCTAYLLGLQPRETDSTLFVGTRPEKRVYRPGENFDPASLQIGVNENGEQLLVQDWYLTEAANLQPGQDHVTAHWQGLSLEVPIVVADGSPFTDVAEDRYAYEPAIWAYYSGIASGVSADRFAPDRSCTRSQMVTFLWRFAGCPKPASNESLFTDVRPGSYYSDAVRWAVEQGITNGTGPSSFSPEETCTRGQMVTFLWRFAGQPEPTGGESSFTDVRPGSYCSDAVRWAVEQGITNGVDSSRFGPERSCTRGHAVTFLYRM